MKKIIISIFMILIIGACSVITYTTINKSKRSIDELNDKIEQLEQENNTLKETIDDLESSNEDDETIKQLNTQITLLNNEINTLKETIEQLENDTENEDLIESLNNKIELLEGVAAVIDKDRSAALLAREIDADTLLILTAVDKVFINYNKPNEESLDEITVSDVKKYIKAGHFAKGSMLPKVEACLEFVEGNIGKKAIIGSLTKASESINGLSGTVIIDK